MDEVERNIATVRRLEYAFNQRDYSDLADIIGGTFEGHNPGATDVTIEGLKANNESWYEAMPDKTTEIVTIFGVGDQVVARIQDRGTNTGGLPWFGLPPNGRAMDMGWIQITRHDTGGRITAMWSIADVVSALTQLGAKPNR